MRQKGRFDLDKVLISTVAATRWFAFCKRIAASLAKDGFKNPYIGCEYLYIEENGAASIRCRINQTIYKLPINKNDYVFKTAT